LKYNGTKRVNKFSGNIKEEMHKCMRNVFSIIKETRSQRGGKKRIRIKMRNKSYFIIGRQNGSRYEAMFTFIGNLYKRDKIS